MHLNPAGVVTSIRSLEAIDQCQFARLGILDVRPNLVSREIGGVQVGLCGIENHAVDTSVGDIFVVLDILIQSSIGLHRKHVAITGVVVERVAVNIVGRLMGGKHENSTSVGLAAGSQGWRELVSEGRNRVCISLTP